jgi:DNA-binding NtrC family response regulator
MMTMSKSKGRILIVDDEVELAETIRDLLQFKGYEAEIASNGIDAQSCLDQNKFDLVISDINMPKMDGMQLLSLINQNYDRIPVVFLSGFSTYDVKAAKANGACGFVSKPIKLNDLLAVVEQNLRRDS